MPITSRTNITTNATKLAIDLVSGAVAVTYQTSSSDGFNFSRSDTVMMDSVSLQDFYLQNQPKIDALAKDAEAFLADKVVPPSSDTTKPTKVTAGTPALTAAINLAVTAAVSKIYAENIVTPKPVTP